ncbi:MAG: GTP-binding protein [Candidatus Lokiarchaeota archaeon]
MSSDIFFKICLFGDGGVGKTTLVNRYLTGVFLSNSTMTIGVDFHIKKLTVDGKRVSLQIWDFAGEERFRFLLPSYVLGSSGGIFMYDITRYTSLKHFDDWIDIFREGYLRIGRNNKLPVILVGGKKDLEYKRTVEPSTAGNIAKRHNLYNYVECSSKTGNNVEDIFADLARYLMHRAGIL